MIQVCPAAVGELKREEVKVNYLVIDLEMCGVPQMYRTGKYKYSNEIIQIGAVLLDQKFMQADTFCQYVHPEYGALDHFISALTGIENKQLKHALPLKEVLHMLIDWIGGRRYKVYAWSENDYCQLAREIRCKEIEDPDIKDFMDQGKWLDYQEIFGRRYKFSRAIGLDEALMLCDIEPDGKFHNGLDDAVNTAKIIEKLEMNPEFQIQNYEQGTNMPPEHLKFSIGDLLANLVF